MLQMERLELETVDQTSSITLDFHIHYFTHKSHIIAH